MLAGYRRSPARRAALHRYNTSEKGRAAWRRFYLTHPLYGYTPATPWEGLPMAYVGDDLFAEARRLTGITGDDEVSRDLLGAAVLALIEGKDPREEVRHLRALEAGWARATVHMTNLDGIGLDGHGQVVVEYQDREGAA